MYQNLKNIKKFQIGRQFLGGPGGIGGQYVVQTYRDFARYFLLK